jgi:hypothetical protein
MENNKKDNNIDIDIDTQKAEVEVPSPLLHYWWGFHRNVLKNIRLYFVIFLMIFLYGVLMLSNLVLETREIKEIIKNDKKSVVSLTNTGRVVAVSKTALKINDFAPIIATLIEDYLVQSRHSLLDYSNKRSFDNATDLFKSQSENPNDKNLQTFYRYFVDLTEDENKFAKGKDAFGKYLTKLVIFLRKNEIPTSVDTMGYTFDKAIDWNTQGNKFRLKVKIKVITSGITEGGVKYSNRKSDGEYEVTGYVDIDKRDDIVNPFGIMFTDIQTSPPKNATDIEIKKFQMENKDY